MRLRLVSSALVAITTLAAAPTAFAGSTDPCVLITAKDAAKVLLATPAQSKTKKAGAFQTCSYASGGKTVTVKTRKVAKLADFTKGVKSGYDQMFPLPKVGDAAFVAMDGKSLLVWSKGVEITFLFGGVSPFVATQQDLGKTAAGRL